MRHRLGLRKLNRTSSHRLAMLRNMTVSLLRHETIRTTLPKAKELRRPMEKLITKAKKGDLANRRRVIAVLGNVQMANCLVDVIAPQIQRNSGYLRIVKLDEYRAGDHAPLARIEFVDELKFDAPKVEKAATTEPAKTPKAEAKPAKKAATTTVRKTTTATKKEAKK